MWTPWRGRSSALETGAQRRRSILAVEHSSLLEPAEVAALIDACRRSFDLATDAEITVEVNPETTSAEDSLTGSARQA